MRDQVIDFVINSNSVFADTVYVSMANTTNNLMMDQIKNRKKKLEKLLGSRIYVRQTKN